MRLKRVCYIINILNRNVNDSRLLGRKADGAGGLNPAAMAGAKMKRITVRRRLVELARSQTEEMDFLKQELDRLR